MSERLDYETPRPDTGGPSDERDPETLQRHVVPLVLNTLSVLAGGFLARYVWGVVMTERSGGEKLELLALICLAPPILLCQAAAFAISVSAAVAHVEPPLPRRARLLLLFTSPLGLLVPLAAWGVARVW